MHHVYKSCLVCLLFLLSSCLRTTAEQALVGTWVRITQLNANELPTEPRKFTFLKDGSFIMEDFNGKTITGTYVERGRGDVEGIPFVDFVLKGTPYQIRLFKGKFRLDVDGVYTDYIFERVDERRVPSQ